MGIFKMVTAGAVGYVAYKAWQRRQGQSTEAASDTSSDRDIQQTTLTGPAAKTATPPHGDPLRTDGTLSPDRKQALGALVIFNEQERTLAQLAVVKGIGGESLQFARKMDEAHSAALTDLSRFAPDRNGTLAQAAAARADGTRKRLDGLNGKEFETQYLQASVTGHEQALALLDTQLSSEPGSSDLGKELQRARETIAEHLEHAKALRTKSTQPH
jgi:predicted outer membrane protein